MIVFSAVNLILFILIALLHLYWAMGGQWKKMEVIPQSEKDKPVFDPGAVATLTVMTGLFLFAGIHAATLGLLLPLLPIEYLRIGLCLIAGVFGLRAMGDFKYVGFFRKIKSGIFATNDRLYYTPLCVLISGNAMATYCLL